MTMPLRRRTHIPRILIIVLLTSTWIGTGAAAPTSSDWTPYLVSRFNFVFDIPPGYQLAEKMRDEHMEGGKFQSIDEPTDTLTIWGMDLPLKDFRLEVEHEKQKHKAAGWDITYERITPKWAAYSGVKDGLIRYMKAITVCDNRAAFLLIDYDRERKLDMTPSSPEWKGDAEGRLLEGSTKRRRSCWTPPKRLSEGTANNFAGGEHVQRQYARARARVTGCYPWDAYYAEALHLPTSHMGAPAPEKDGPTILELLRRAVGGLTSRPEGGLASTLPNCSHPRLFPSTPLALPWRDSTLQCWTSSLRTGAATRLR